MKAWHDDIDAATLQRIKTYSAFNDPESKNLMVQTMYEYRQEEVEELEAQIEKMKCCGNCIHCKYDENEESYEFCEKHQQVVNIAVVPCSEWNGR